MIEEKELDYEVGQMFASATEELIIRNFPELARLDLAVESFTYFNWDGPAYFVFARSSYDNHKYVEFIIDEVNVNGDSIIPSSIKVASHGLPAFGGVIKDVWKVDYERDFV